MEATRTHKYTLFGGSRGPGKSWWLRHWLLLFVLSMNDKGFKPATVGIFCEDYPSLKDRQISKMAQWPRSLGRVKNSHTDGLGFYLNNNRGVIALRNLDDPSKFQSAEFAAIGIDELTKNPQTVFDLLRGSLRWPGFNDVRFAATANPGGLGHQWVKSYWIDREYPPELECDADEFAFVRALPDDNKHLDPSYWHMLETLPEPLRSAWRYGLWDVWEGQMFQITNRHVIEPVDVPETVPIIMTFDWGFGKPFSLGWWWIDQDNRLYRFSEFYGANKARGTSDVGLRLPDEDIADIIIKEEYRIGLSQRKVTRICDPTCFNKKPDYRGGGQGPSTAEVFATKGIVMQPGDPSRVLKIRQVHSRLRLPEESWELPMMVVYNTCKDWVRTMKLLQVDEKNPDDVDTRMEDHIYDETALAAMARPMSIRAAAMMEDPVEMGAIG